MVPDTRDYRGISEEAPEHSIYFPSVKEKHALLASLTNRIDALFKFTLQESSLNAWPLLVTYNR